MVGIKDAVESKDNVLHMSWLPFLPFLMKKRSGKRNESKKIGRIEKFVHQS